MTTRVGRLDSLVFLRIAQTSCGGCLFGIVLMLVGGLLGWLDDRAQIDKDIYEAARGKTFKIDYDRRS